MTDLDVCMKQIKEAVESDYIELLREIWLRNENGPGDEFGFLPSDIEERLDQLFHSRGETWLTAAEVKKRYFS